VAIENWSCVHACALHLAVPLSFMWIFLIVVLGSYFDVLGLLGSKLTIWLLFFEVRHGNVKFIYGECICVVISYNEISFIFGHFSPFLAFTGLILG
jgi:hypothetical protein